MTDFGINAAIFGMVAHGLITGMLFFIAGSVKERYHTLEIKRLGGLLVQAPHMGWILGFCTMASLGLPGLAGFWGEFPAILASYNPVPGSAVETFRVYMVVAAIGTVLAAGYLLWLLQRTAFGEPVRGVRRRPRSTTSPPSSGSRGRRCSSSSCCSASTPGLVFEVTDPAIVQVADRACISAADGDEEIAAGCVRPEAVTLAQERVAAEATTATSRSTRTRRRRG